MLSIKVDVSLATVPVKVMVWAPLLETENGILKMPKLVLAGDTVLPIWCTVDRCDNRIEVGRHGGIRASRRLERQRVAAGVQVHRLADATGALDEGGLGAVGCGGGAPCAAVALDAAAIGEGPANARCGRGVLIASTQYRRLESRIDQGQAAARRSSSATLSMKVDLSPAMVPVKVMACAPVVATENETLKLAKPVLVGDTGLPTGIPSHADLDRLHVRGDAARSLCRLERQRVAAGSRGSTSG